jgi:uncharacterized protein (DUF2252 family)
VNMSSIEPSIPEPSFPEPSIPEPSIPDDSLPAGMRVEHGHLVPHLTLDERTARGRAARREVPRSSHADIGLSPYRPDPVALLEQQAEQRIPELVPIRHGRMMETPFTFFRGAALIMASDLAGTPRSGITTQVCGDAHLTNFGLFATPERRLVFGLNDFDETIPGPWEWDVKRLATSFVIASRENGYADRECATIARATVAAYRASMRELAGRNHLDVWYSTIDIGDVLARLEGKEDRKLKQRAEARVAKSRRRDHLQAFEKLTTVVDGRARFVSDPPLLQPIAELLSDVDAAAIDEMVRSLIRRYRRSLNSDRRHLLEEFEVVDLARKVVGVGSVGTRAWVILLLGRDARDPLILQAKEAPPSVLEPFVGAGTFASNGERVVEGQRLMQPATDIFLGWETVTGRDGRTVDYYVRQLRDWKGAVEVATLPPRGMQLYGEVCARALALAHARSGDRVAIASYLGSGETFDRAIAEFASSYADQNERDHAAFVAAIDEGRIAATRGI